MRSGQDDRGSLDPPGSAAVPAFLLGEEKRTYSILDGRAGRSGAACVIGVEALEHKDGHF